MTRFEHCLSHVLRHEGGYADHPADPGSATNMGITRRTLAEWRGVSPWSDLPKSAVMALSRVEAAEIYQARYWSKCAADLLPTGLDFALFDFAVNSGPTRAVKYLQIQIGVEADGIVGPRTLSAVEKCRRGRGAKQLIETLCDNRLNFLRGLNTFSTFGRGWTTRVATVRGQALKDASSFPETQNHPNRSGPMNMLSGYKTYIVAAAMLVAGLSQLLGVDLPGFEDQSAMQLIMESMAVIFLRRGVGPSNPG